MADTSSSEPLADPSGATTQPLPASPAEPAEPAESDTTIASPPAPSGEVAPAQVDSPAPHHIEPALIVALIAGTLVFALLAFGIGWTARGAADRISLSRAHGFIAGGQARGPFGGGFGQGFGAHRFGGAYSAPQFGQGRGGFGQGYGQGYGHRGMGWRQIPSQTPTQPLSPEQTQ